MDYTHVPKSSEFEFCIALIEIYDGLLCSGGILGVAEVSTQANTALAFHCQQRPSSYNAARQGSARLPCFK
jgi:hypothetical protein